MDSIPDGEALARQIKETAHTVAYRTRLPWDLKGLIEAGFWAAMRAQDEYRAKKEGLGGVTFEAYAQGGIEREMLAIAEGLRAQAADSEKRPPSEQETEMALKAFDASEWKVLIESMDQVEVEMFRSYQQQNTEELKQRFGARKVECIEASTIMRSTELWRRSDGPKGLVAVSDAYWAVFWREQARFLNIQGKGHTSTGRSLDEATSDRNTARRLRKRDETSGHDMPVSPYKVKQWRKRWEESSEDFDGDLLNYWMMTYFKKTADSHHRSRGNNNK